MKNIEQILKEAGIEVTDEQKAAVNKAVTENYKTIAEFDKQSKKLADSESALETANQQLKDAQETLKGFDGVDVDGFKKKIADLEEKIKTTEKEADAKIYERDYNDALKAELDAYKFTSEAAKRDVSSQAKAANLTLKDGKLLGFADLMGQIKKSDASAFVDEEAEAAKKAEDEAKAKAAGSAPKFTDKSEPKHEPSKGETKVPLIF